VADVADETRFEWAFPYARDLFAHVRRSLHVANPARLWRAIDPDPGTGKPRSARHGPHSGGGYRTSSRAQELIYTSHLHEGPARQTDVRALCLCFS